MFYSLDEIMIFCDFDGTITKIDCIDKLLSMYANNKWEEIEKLWNENKIGSKECLKLQFDCIENITMKDLLKFAHNIEIDPYFISFIKQVKKYAYPFYIVSDGFDFFINSVLKKNEIGNIPVFSNSFDFNNGKFTLSFPYSSEKCLSKSGICKCEVINKFKSDKSVIYIGDGRSDMCAVRNADLVFAKGKLARYCAENSIKFIEYSNFNEIINNLFIKGNKYVAV